MTMRSLDRNVWKHLKKYVAKLMSQQTQKKGRIANDPPPNPSCHYALVAQQTSRFLAIMDLEAGSFPPTFLCDSVECVLKFKEKVD